MFKKTLVVSVGLPREVWEPLRKLNEIEGLSHYSLAEAFDVSPYEMRRVLCAAELAHLRKSENVGLDILEPKGF